MPSSGRPALPINFAMNGRPDSCIRRALRRLAGGVLLAGLLAAVAPAAGSAATTTFGSPLSVPATLNTTANLNYYGTYTPVPPNPEAPNGLYHTNHWGADDALWNVALANGTPSAPATGQVLKVSLEGCAQPAAGGPRPLTQFHIQDITPLGGGSVHVNLTSQPFDIPVCGENGASGSTVSTYEPINLCVSAGDYVDFNDEGGYVPYIYRSGVPYQVIGATQGSIMDSFIRANGTNNGATLSGTDTTANDGFSENRGEELMLQATLGTGPDATHLCPGGTAGLAPPRPPLPPLRIAAQTDGVNHRGVVAVAIYCRSTGGCRGLATLGPAGGLSGYGSGRRYGHASFSLRGGHTSHVPIHVSAALMRRIRRNHGSSALLTVAMGGQTFTQTISIKIF
jgi:hypothetical protein